MTLPLSKTLDLADYEELTEELQVVDRHFTSASEQHPARRWEYAMALRALKVWKDGKDYRLPASIADVGGGGSPFASMVPVWPLIIDPEVSFTLAHYVTTPWHSEGETHPRLYQAVFCLSVLEHVDDPNQFLYHLSCLVAPGGLLFLTMDCCDCPRHGIGRADTHHFHWMRKRIFSIREWQSLLYEFRLNPPLSLLGDVDWSYHGDHVYDYSFASLALVKRA